MRLLGRIHGFLATKIYFYVFQDLFPRNLKKQKSKRVRKKYTIGKGSNISTFFFVVLPALFGENLGLQYYLEKNCFFLHHLAKKWLYYTICRQVGKKSIGEKLPEKNDGHLKNRLRTWCVIKCRLKYSSAL